MQIELYRERALLKFKRYYLHEIRDGKPSRTAATVSLWKARNELLEELKDVPSTDAERGVDPNPSPLPDPKLI